MIPHVIQEGMITAEDVQLANDLHHAMIRLPDSFSCHDVCAHLLRRCPIGWAHHRGRFNVGWAHSWLYHEDRQLILDLYPIAVGTGPILLFAGRMSPWSQSYVGTPVE